MRERDRLEPSRIGRSSALLRGALGGGCSERVEIENEMENEMKTSINLRSTVYYRMIFVKIRLKSNFSVVRHFLENVKTSEKLS